MTGVQTCALPIYATEGDFFFATAGGVNTEQCKPERPHIKRLADGNILDTVKFDAYLLVMQHTTAHQYPVFSDTETDRKSVV